jgi:hypothetical protein
MPPPNTVRMPDFTNQHEKQSISENISVPGHFTVDAGQDAGPFGLARTQSRMAIDWIVRVAFAVLRDGKAFDNRALR